MNAIDEYCTSYLDKIFYFSLKRTGDELAAEELASDISCEIIASLKRGAAPDCLGAWIWKVAANVWGRFAKRRWYSAGFADADIDDFAELLADDSDFTQELVLQEELTLMRRTLAHIRSDYRRILVAHYIEEKSVSEIARACSLPVGTVKTKLISLKINFQTTSFVASRSVTSISLARNRRKTSTQIRKTSLARSHGHKQQKGIESRYGYGKRIRNPQL